MRACLEVWINYVLLGDPSDAQRNRLIAQRDQSIAQIGQMRTTCRELQSHSSTHSLLRVFFDTGSDGPCLYRKTLAYNNNAESSQVKSTMFHGRRLITASMPVS